MPTAARFTRRRSTPVHVRRFASWLGAEGLLPDAVAAFEPEHLARFLASAVARQRADGRAKRSGSLNAERSSPRGLFDYHEWAWIVEQSPAHVLRIARVGSTPPKGLKREEVGSLLAVLAADPGQTACCDHALVSFLLGTGTRLGSALALELVDLDLASCTATLRELAGGGSMTP